MMLFRQEEVIDGKYRVTGLCSDAGGMGTILHVTPTQGAYPFPIVLKYCKDLAADSLARFRRETRYLLELQGNSKIVAVMDSNLQYDPPYFVMKFYPDGDLMGMLARIKSDVGVQEKVFNAILDCIAELHAKGLFHRDIKPQNFLVDGERVVVSDFGLAKVMGAGTTFTTTKDFLGSYGYIPPEFYRSGFRDCTAASDVFMIGKTFYVLLTGQDPQYISDAGIPPAIFHMIERCCDTDAPRRYQSVAEARQALKLAYDVALGRAAGLGKARQMLSQITNRLDTANQYANDEIIALLDLLAMLLPDERNSMFRAIPDKLYNVLAVSAFDDRLPTFLKHYGEFAIDAVSDWSYAETVADNMKVIFEKSRVNASRVKALDIAVAGAIRANRFAAMDTCKAMITAAPNDELGVGVATVIDRYKGSFVMGIETADCVSDAVILALKAANAPEAK